MIGRRRGGRDRPGDVIASGPASVAVGGDVLAPITTQVFVGGFARLRDAWLDPSGIFDAVSVESFTGRRWLVRQIDEFIEKFDRAYIVVEADAGLGKTAFAAWLASKEGCPCHFTRSARGTVSTVALRNLAAQLIPAWDLEDYTLGGILPEAAGEPGWFERLLRDAAAKAMTAGESCSLSLTGSTGPNLWRVACH